eukprot:TRINITY_DN11856_c0_g1_i1.p1 TRINITY_DN11856_c0_g1~~TRINITY_DN11856_c0_g1_i1.p1  ORF type:complete len:131 (-),score=22.27 TRINITY_DN11856_c0_g1_i1:93-485(-)
MNTKWILLLSIIVLIKYKSNAENPQKNYQILEDEPPIADTPTNPTTNPDQIPLLPFPTGNEDAQQMVVNGEPIRFDHLGPMIINQDGTIGRITNWDSLSEKEQEVAWRRIANRNKIRRQQLQEELDGADV